MYCVQYYELWRSHSRNRWFTTFFSLVELEDKMAGNDQLSQSQDPTSKTKHYYNLVTLPKISYRSGKFYWVALLVADPPCANSTTRHNPSICNNPLYKLVMFEQRGCWNRVSLPTKQTNGPLLHLHKISPFLHTQVNWTLYWFWFLLCIPSNP